MTIPDLIPDTVPGIKENEALKEKLTNGMRRRRWEPINSNKTTTDYYLKCLLPEVDNSFH